MAEILRCPGCAAELTADAPEGLYPECLYQGIVEGQDEAEAPTPGRTPPSGFVPPAAAAEPTPPEGTRTAIDLIANRMQALTHEDGRLVIDAGSPDFLNTYVPLSLSHSSLDATSSAM